jgi:hypothetical protein
MKNKGLILSVLAILFGTLLSCNAQTTEQNQANEGISNDKVEVYYFHFERRCATCQAVESESEKVLSELYPEKIKSGEITFLLINLEEESNGALADKLNISGQTLLIVKGDKQENLTNAAFMHARTNPEKLKKAIKETIEKL